MTSAAGIGAYVRRFSHVVVNVTDLKRSVAFYEAVSTLRCTATFDAPEPSTPPANQVGISRVAIEVADFDACHDALSSLYADRAFGPLGEIVTVKTGDPIGNRHVCYLTDPNGHLLELFEPYSRTFVALRPDGA